MKAGEPVFLLLPSCGELRLWQLCLCFEFYSNHQRQRSIGKQDLGSQSLLLLFALLFLDRVSLRSSPGRNSFCTTTPNYEVSLKWSI